MSLSIYFKKMLGLDLTDDYVWLSSEYVTDFKTDSYIDGTKVLGGINNCNLILKPNANIEIEQIFQGTIIGIQQKK